MSSSGIVYVVVFLLTMSLCAHAYKENLLKHNKTPKQFNLKHSDADCKACLQFADHVGEAIRNNSFTFKMVLMDACQLTALKKHCGTVVPRVYDAIEDVLPILYPNMDHHLCVELRQCPKDLPPGYSINATSTVVAAQANGWICDICLEFTKELYTETGNASFVNQLKRLIDREVCAKLPEAEDKECQEFVDFGIPMAIEELHAYLKDHQRQFCEELWLCSAKKPVRGKLHRAIKYQQKLRRAMTMY